jgi:hypothetical protein
MARMASKKLRAVVFYVAWAVNPALFTGCGLVDSLFFDFGEADMVRLAGAASRAEPYRFTDAGGQAFEVSVELRQARGEAKVSAGPSFVTPAHACGTRTFYRSAGACIDLTRMPVEGTMTVKKVSPEVAVVADHAPANGELVVGGTKLTAGSLMVEAGDHSFGFHSDDAKAFVLTEVKLRGVGPGGATIAYQAPR